MKLSDKQLKIIVETAAQEAIKAYRENEKKIEKEKKDGRLRNIKLLLKHYRALVLHCEKLEDDLIEFSNTSIQELDLDTITPEAIESIKKSKTKSLAMIYFIKGKMEAYRRSCSKEEMKYYRILEMMYLSPEKIPISEIARRENIDRSTVYRYLDKATEDLSVIFFGVDAIKFE